MGYFRFICVIRSSWIEPLIEEKIRNNLSTITITQANYPGVSQAQKLTKLIKLRNLN